MKSSTQNINTSKIKTINVTELNIILQNYFKCKETFIEVVEVADITHQHTPLKREVGIGGVLNITFSSSRRLK